VDAEAIIERAKIPVVQRVLVGGVRGTIGDVAGQRAIILNRRHRFSSEQERRWVLAEELGHVLLDHKLVESTEPGQPVIGLLEERRVIYEREARAFAAELLMPFFEVRKRWFAVSRELPLKGVEPGEEGGTACHGVRRHPGGDARAASANEGYFRVR
jgi:hypothetical protein